MKDLENIMDDIARNASAIIIFRKVNVDGKKELKAITKLALSELMGKRQRGFMELEKYILKDSEFLNKGLY